jgi:hypothetical protein
LLSRRDISLPSQVGLRPVLVPPPVRGVKCGTEYHQFEGDELVGFLTWGEAAVATALIVLLVLYLILRDRRDR